MAIAGKSDKLAIVDSTPSTVVGIKNWSIDLSLGSKKYIINQKGVLTRNILLIEKMY